MSAKRDGVARSGLILGTSYLLVSLLLLVVLLTFDLGPGVFYGILTPCVVSGLLGALILWRVRKEVFMRIGIVERIRERRRIAVAAALMERYNGVDLMNTPEAGALPTPIYECGGCGSSYDRTADRLYWVDDEPLLSAGWYCDDCVDKLEGKPRHERLNIEIFLIMLDSDIGSN